MRWAAIFFALVAIAAAGWYFKQQTDSQTGKFGNMPAVEGVTRSDILDIVSYIRALQRANGVN